MLAPLPLPEGESEGVGGASHVDHGIVFRINSSAVRNERPLMYGP